MGVRLRTTLTATAVVAVALCVASAALFAALDSSLSASTKKVAVLDAKRHEVQMIYAKGAPGGGAASGTETGDVAGVRADGPSPGPSKAGSGSGADSVSGTGSASGTDTASGTGAASGSAPPGKSFTASEQFVVAKNGDGLIEVSKVIETRQGPVTVIGRASTEPASAALGTLRNMLLPGVPALLALVALATWLAVGRVLRPVSAIRAKLADITASDLHEHVPVPTTRDEVAALARTVNATLDRLRTAVAAHRQFVADAAHELRSPMAILRTRLELAAPAERRLASGALDDVARLQSLTADLLLLARLDAREPLRAKELDLAQVVAEEAARTRPRTDVRVTLDLASDLLVHGSRDQLRRLVANLVDNAVRHAAGTVTVTLSGHPDRAVLDITDDGPGIPPQHRTTVFDRFTRLDHARARDTGGSGLGLPIARDIARAHGGTLIVLPGEAGAHLRAVLPLAGCPAVGRPTAVPAPMPVVAPVPVPIPTPASAPAPVPAPVQVQVRARGAG